MPIKEFVDGIYTITDMSVQYDALFSFMLNMDLMLQKTVISLNSDTDKDFRELINFMDVFMDVLGHILFNPDLVRYVNRSIPSITSSFQNTTKQDHPNFHKQLTDLFVAIMVQYKKINGEIPLPMDHKKLIFKKIHPELLSLIKLIKAKAHPSMIAIENIDILS